ncbi:MAG: hypothetical protein COZ06_10115 [Armatimonadetes bacterium CG_4_10_14_3_um_filter_66_18]|nr:hypothetical protein [Armatimonadota bacterium]OIO96335.1 MAG: hypothetical protein AUJ96_24875 [Armatimonadetes bacterium CG2_30_66_41]PIX47141.1 MAG: hypothetical protein COZ57_09370 [Armatimonadetes bacterium CG_4_8_14_3_um_filter_66_20]PIY50289.1 MAG: hypothetical protein COZ06_10115 [Armatimonadetes bacterium CG_4_10_14_3_um_filter_66_18]PIZ34753.1 MAG: hypothetical protein COY42_27940 [Armatimonadetes bacterium CG_4_10_14_0_8_um_filter_66_14]PJB67136.1 MAG: hypothetical protein CO096_
MVQSAALAKAKVETPVPDLVVVSGPPAGPAKDRFFVRTATGLRQDVLQLGRRVFAATAEAVVALRRHNPLRASTVIAGHNELEERRLRIERDCLALLASTRTLAGERRLVAGLIHIARDFTRIGENAVDIAAVARDLPAAIRAQLPERFWQLCDEAPALVACALDSLSARDAVGARTVCERAQSMHHLRVLSEAALFILANTSADLLPSIFRLSSVVRNVERIIESASEIALQAIYLTTGRVERVDPDREWASLRFSLN